MLEYPQFLDLASCLPVRSRMEGFPTSNEKARLYPYAREQQEQDLQGLSSPGTTNYFSVTFGDAWKEHGQHQSGWNPSSWSLFWQACSRGLGYTMIAALGSHLWRVLAKKKFNELSLLWAHGFHTNIQELWLFVERGWATCLEGCTPYRWADFRTLWPFLKRRPK